jgi:hypothetical protein
MQQKFCKSHWHWRLEHEDEKNGRDSGDCFLIGLVLAQWKLRQPQGQVVQRFQDGIRTGGPGA